jgi:glycolate oxidase iron-sulfur subunit
MKASVQKEKNHGPLERYRDEISRCVKCGSCSAVCPTFLHERAESFSARGRMALVEAVLDKRLRISRTYLDRLKTCTTCLACETSCASNVRVTEIIQAAKEQAVEEAGVGAVGAVVSAVLKRPAVFRTVARFAPIALHYAGGSITGCRGSSKFNVQSAKIKVQHSRQTGDKKKGSKGKIIFFPGCAVRYFQPDIGVATGRVLNALGYDLVVPDGLKCCGRPLLSLGDRKGAAALAAHNSRILVGLEADAIVTACASCGLTFKREYPKLLRPGAKGPVIFDIHEFLADRLGDARLAPVQKSVTVHDPCHLGRGQGLSKTTRDLLEAIPGITLLEMQDPDRCCGFGGVMRVTHRGLSDGIAEEKAKNIIATKASLVATGCPGCRMQITDVLRRAGSEVEVLHPVQILEEALEGAE